MWYNVGIWEIITWYGIIKHSEKYFFNYRLSKEWWHLIFFNMLPKYSYPFNYLLMNLMCKQAEAQIVATTQTVDRLSIHKIIIVSHQQTVARVGLHLYPYCHYRWNCHRYSSIQASPKIYICLEALLMDWGLGHFGHPPPKKNRITPDICNNAV